MSNFGYPNFYTTNGTGSNTLVTNLRRRGTVPNSQQLFQDIDLIELANGELFNTVVANILSADSMYYVTNADYTIQTSPPGAPTVPPQVVNYPIPSNALGAKLQEVVFVDNNGNYTEVPNLGLSKVAGNWDNSYQYLGFYIIDNNLILYPNWSQSGILRMFYCAKPNRLDDVANAGQITSINTLTNSVTVNNVPATWVPGTQLTIIGNYQPFNPVFQDTSIVSVSSPTVTLSSLTNSIGQSIQVGDWVCNNGFTVVPQGPTEMQGLLEQATVVKIWEANANWDALKVAQEKLTEMMTNFVNNYITDRVTDEPSKITNNGRGLSDYASMNPRLLF